MIESIFLALVGGGIIGLAVSLMLLFNGRVTGISGIVGTILKLPKGDMAWRICFVSGLFLGGYIMNKMHPEYFVDSSGRQLATVGVAGLLVGFGTMMGTGCTSGHAVCGISRFSKRSLFATISFMATGFVTATIFSLLLGN